ncbi:hypothetical protein L596_005480 [Steinernema carpocapsae]|uniref:Uncharacterized protein n=1 Tax=Steinernema carpocapsae TaxID=34508 RepID=A0A4U8V0B4_STECR|nr:hypothetical protein L596_005480 [Steinernema carpocapsae]
MRRFPCIRSLFAPLKLRHQQPTTYTLHRRRRRQKCFSLQPCQLQVLYQPDQPMLKYSGKQNKIALRRRRPQKKRSQSDDNIIKKKHSLRTRKCTKADAI